MATHEELVRFKKVKEAFERLSPSDQESVLATICPHNTAGITTQDRVNGSRIVFVTLCDAKHSARLADLVLQLARENTQTPEVPA